MIAGRKTTLLAVLFVIITAVFIIFAEKYKNMADAARVIGFPKDTIWLNDSEYLIIIEVHDYENNAIRMDTIWRKKRVPSTLEDFDPKYRLSR